MPKHALKVIADGLFQSKIHYGACLYERPLLSKEESHSGEVQKLQVLQNEVNRLLMGVRRSDRIRNSDLSEMTGLPTVNQIAASQALQELRKILVDCSVPEIQMVLIERVESSGYGTRAMNDYKLTSPLLGNKDFLSGAIRLWNAAPQGLRDARNNPSAFKALTRLFVSTLP